ncbi:family 43 glycosylhydrolase [Echinicola shivajiensis]|uniref:family 43 glycosylhydrolase n=1 Tax=Echinicola shivajiensis TaxID=1035916 RepID=UPI001BFC9352|nr:family 43 glycosylhydrolase [Echinicola shivajiensis]
MSKYALIFIVICFFACGGVKEKQVQEQPKPIPNPVIKGEFPDPSVIEVDGTYYACGTSNDWAPIYPIYSSKDLENWTFESYVFSEKPEWTMSGFWAPELFYHNGTFYCYYTAKRKNGVSCIGVATTKDISKGFEDHGILIEWGSESIDAFVFDDGGELYVTWKAYGLNPDKPIQILGSGLSKDGLELKGEVFEVVTAEADTWERGGIEGQSMVKNDDYYYLLYSGAACCGGGCDYKVGVARAKSVTGPWEKYTGNPILSDFGDWKCPGHGTPIEDESGDWYYLYHAYAKEGFPYLGRSGLINRFYWDEESGWPYFKVNELIDESSGHVQPVDFEDDFGANELAPQWRWDLASYSPEVEIEKGVLKLSGKGSLSNNGLGAVLNVVPENANYEIKVTLNIQQGVFKGLVLYGTHENMIGLGLQEKNLTLFEIREGNYQELGAVKTEIDDEATLRAVVSDGHQVSFSYQSNSGEWMKIVPEGNKGAVLKGDYLSFWQWGVKPGIFVKGGQKGEFKAFDLTY